MSSLRTRLAVLVSVMSLGLAATALAQDQALQSLRGDAPVTEAPPAPDVKKQNTDPARFGRAYRQQPPLIPHRIDHYQIDLRVNKCLQCHDWPHNVQENAPKISETHYTNREGVALDHVARNRWFCT
ncbi:MAG: nitrate reductase cytochrome c-type subunit, partial [Kiloniellales bacterium]|nr:nitrate reductase cytochrome c-type subunit [Kiloniellales bacterium]